MTLSHSNDQSILLRIGRYTGVRSKNAVGQADDGVKVEIL